MARWVRGKEQVLEQSKRSGLLFLLVKLERPVGVGYVDLELQTRGKFWERSAYR